MWPKCDLCTETYLLEPPLEAAGGEDGIWEGATGKGGRFLKNVRGLLKPTFFILCKGSQQPRGIRSGVRKKGGEEGLWSGHGPHSCGLSINHLNTRR